MRCSRILKPGDPGRCALLMLCLFAMTALGCASSWPDGVMYSLAHSGENRRELEQVLHHYRDGGDPLKIEAAAFLIGNMEGHGYAVSALHDADHNRIEYDALDYATFNEALEAIEALEAEHGELDFARIRFEPDVRTISADYLIENIDLAFRAWREKPWAKDLSFRAFCEYVLPYRGSNEPVNRWRRACLDRYADLPAQMEDPSDANEAAKLIRRDVHRWVRFSDLYYLHPTDQGFAEMNARGVGRCEDISNMMGYAMRANAIPVATDYTPYWADRDNNHAWEVVLDEHGHGRAGLSNRAAKIYRKTFAIQGDTLGAIRTDLETVPKWLAGRNFIDVTNQYLTTSDVTVELEGDPPRGARFAYLCVFNGGEWKAIHWGLIEDGAVTFTDLGRRIAYLPAFHTRGELQPAAAPFILDEQGAIHPLAADPDRAMTIELVATTPETPDADTLLDRPMIAVKPGRVYELFVWEDGWRSLGTRTAGEEPVAYDSVPTGGLFWLVEEGSRRLERIFTFENGVQTWW
ncbi:MAG: transglutaminase domain-containing protein [Planctomycetota bacterium]|nr:transglutaminase domain-containing protein [Planctomycetota bacterium]